MSFFYLNPVKGDIAAHLVEKIIIQRLQFMDATLKGDNTGYNEYVVEGSVYDNVGHFMLCAISILGVNTEFSQYFVKGEVELFKRRILSLGTYELRCFAKKLIRNIKKHEHVPSYIESLQVLCQHLMLKDLAQHICTLHKAECDIFKIKISFKHCLKFIAKREVELQNGIVYLPCGKWKHFLTILFTDNLKKRLIITDMSALKSDPRIMDLLQKVRQDYFPHSVKDNMTVLLSKEVDNKLKHFPLCMLNLHLELRKKHRLSHSQRFYYSLFLKDIGMPVDESVDFWRAEYTQSPKGSHSCCHNWVKDEKKYLYGIRHMYGLEGAKKNYTSVNCQRIQSVDNACSEGGCPFKSFDDSKMSSLLHNPSEQLMSQIKDFRTKNQYTESCLLYMNSLVEIASCDNLSFSFTPVKYYSIASKCLAN